MVKEVELLKAVKTNDKTKIQKILVPEKGYQIQKVTHTSPGGIPGGRIRMNVVHVDINCHEEETGYTPLILAVLHGNRDVVENLLFYSAHVDVPDGKGNTPLHVAVWTGRLDLIHILLKDGAKVNMTNSDGDSPLHIACQVDIENRTQVINSLLRSSVDVAIRNKKGLLAIDIAAMYNRKDAVSELLDHAPYLSTTTSALVEASIRGYKNIVHLLLDYGVNPNLMDTDRQTCALHEATRFARLEVAEILLKFGASSEMENGKKETPIKLSSDFPDPVKDKFQKLFEDYAKSGPTEVPRFAVVDPLKSPKPDLKDYPELPTLPEWTENSLDFCNECTAENPNTNLLDGQLDTFWVIPAVTQAWTILDLQFPHILTGICVYSWDSTQMMKQFALQKAESTLGPWITVKTFYCERIGSTDPSEAGVPQFFKDFTDTSQYWRLNILSNHGGLYTCFQAIKLFGADCRIKQMLDDIHMSKYADSFIKAGFNTYRKALLVSKSDLSSIITDQSDLPIAEKMISEKRQKGFPLTWLKWLQPPPYSCTEGKTLPDVVVKGDVGCTEKIKIYVDDIAITGDTEAELVYDETECVSTAKFCNLCIQKAGIHQLVIQGIHNPSVSIKAPSTIEIKPKSSLTPEMEKSFADMQAMLQGLQDSLDFPT